MALHVVELINPEGLTPCKLLSCTFPEVSERLLRGLLHLLGYEMGCLHTLHMIPAYNMLAIASRLALETRPVARSSGKANAFCVGECCC